MPRYIDADALETAILTRYRSNWENPCSSEDRLIQRVVTDLRDLIEKSVTADVVPKSEASKLKEEYDRLKLEYAGFEAGAKAAARFIQADTVRKMQERFRELVVVDLMATTKEQALFVINQIAKELLEDAPPRKAPEP